MFAVIRTDIRKRNRSYDCARLFRGRLVCQLIHLAPYVPSFLDDIVCETAAKKHASKHKPCMRRDLVPDIAFGDMDFPHIASRAEIAAIHFRLRDGERVVRKFMYRYSMLTFSKITDAWAPRAALVPLRSGEPQLTGEPSPQCHHSQHQATA